MNEPPTLRCAYCGGDLFAPDHEIRCDGRQGVIEETIARQDADPDLADAADPLTTFDAAASEAAKEHGQAAAADRRRFVLDVARSVARDIAQQDPFRRCHADQVMRRLIALDYAPADLGNAAGSVFKTDEWEFAGEWRPSVRVSNHGRRTMVWRLK